MSSSFSLFVYRGRSPEILLTKALLTADQIARIWIRNVGSNWIRQLVRAPFVLLLVSRLRTVGRRRLAWHNERITINLVSVYRPHHQ